MFSLINVGERAGTGLCDLFNIWNECGFTPPVLKESIDPDRITLTLQIETSGNHGAPADEKRAGNAEGNEGNAGGNVSNDEGNAGENEGNIEGNESNAESLSDKEKQVLAAIMTNATVSAAKISGQIGVSKSTVERVIHSLKSKEYIKREGATRGKWIILKGISKNHRA
jgi:predicted HTH transcriptional regulator